MCKKASLKRPLPVALHLTWWRFDPPGDPSLVKTSERKPGTFTVTWEERRRASSVSGELHLSSHENKSNQMFDPTKLREPRCDVTLPGLVEDDDSDGEGANWRQSFDAPGQVSLTWARLSRVGTFPHILAPLRFKGRKRLFLKRWNQLLG